MIFKCVSKIKDSKCKKIFIEHVQIYIRLIEVFCEKNNINFAQIDETPPIAQLILIGVIQSELELVELKKILKTHFIDFIKAVNFSSTHDAKLNGLTDNLSNAKRFEVQQKNKTKEPTLVDFFCGAGGFSLGFIQEGFNIKFANDIEDVCIQTYKYNHPELEHDKLVKGDIKTIVENVNLYITDDIDVVIGGPPCQGFSPANRQRVIDDPRNELYKYFLKAVEKISPKFVVMENVKGMLSVADQVVEDYTNLKTQNNLSYLVNYSLLNSQDFSVAQSRERLIFIAIRSDIATTKDISPSQIFNLIKDNCDTNKSYVLDDALANIKPLDSPRIKNTNEVDSETTGKKIDVNKYKNPNSYLQLINNKREIPYVFNHKARFCNDINHEIYKKLTQGDDATDDKIKDIMPYSHRNHCFKDKYYKLIGNRPCRTITAHMRMDCHSHIHPYQVRSLTPREAARVQSFPDDYLFLGAYLKTYMQIGNAVPPLMSRGIATIIKKYI